MGYWIGGIVIALIAWLCIRSIVKDLRRGKCVGCSLGSCSKCGGGCASCGGGCPSRMETDEAAVTKQPESPKGKQ